MPRSARAKIVTFGLIAAMACVPLAAASMNLGYLNVLVARIAILALAAVSLDLLVGYAGILSFGHAAFYGLGAYTVGILAFHADADGFAAGRSALFVLPTAVIVTVLFAVATGALSLRTGGAYYVMISLSFAQMLYFLFAALSAYGGDDGLIIDQRFQLPFVSLRDDATFLYFALFWLAAFTWFFFRVVEAPFGYVVRGIRQNERRMRALGFNTDAFRLAAIALASAGVGLAGALNAALTTFVSPDFLHWTFSGEMLAMIILGGTGTLVGPVIGAMLVILLEEVLSEITGHALLTLGILILVILLFARKGLYALLFQRDVRRG